MHLVAPAATLLALGAVLTGCGGSPSRSAGGGAATALAPTSQQTVTDTVLPPATTVSTSPTASPTGGVRVCATAALRISLGAPAGAAGSEIYRLHFVNSAGAPCTISGFPGVSYVAPGNGIQVGPAATRGTADGGPVGSVTLAPGAAATSLVLAGDAQNFPSASCGATPVSGFRVYPPGNTTATYVAFATQQTGCSKAATLQVQPVLAAVRS